MLFPRPEDRRASVAQTHYCDSCVPVAAGGRTGTAAHERRQADIESATGPGLEPARPHRYSLPELPLRDQLETDPVKSGFQSR